MSDPATASARPADPTIAQLREVTQPPSVRTRAGAEHWVAHAYLRDISPYLTRLLLRAGLTANGVTWLMILSAALAAVGHRLAHPARGGPGRGARPAADAARLQRRRGRPLAATSSPLGVYLDRVGHYVAECGIAVALGVRATGELRVSGPWISAGLLLGLLVALNKVENDLVHVARHYAGMTQMRDAEEVRVPSRGLLRRARQVARFVPFHRVFHSVELSLLVLAAALVDLVADGVATRVLLAGLVAAAVVTVVGHLAAVLGSARLR